ncbi:MAG: hypothetical protein IKB70_00470 [Bacilli bacterium]|nr:hypothetical protein [Bacilli bacterium]
MEIRTNQTVYSIWQDAYKGFVPRELKVVGIESKLKNGEKMYHLFCKTNKVNVYTTVHKLYLTIEEAQKECDRRNGNM